MKKHIIKALCCTLLALPALTSCELDQFPSDSLTDEESWKSYTDATNQYNGLMAQLRSDVGGANAYISDVMTDLFNQRMTSMTLQKEHTWSFTGSDFSGDVIYANNYSVVLQANYILNNIDRVENGTTQLTAMQQANLDNIKASAYFARAYAYSNLVTRYCKDYEPETAAQELGLPIVQTVSSEARPERATLQATCDSIEKDMDRAQLYFDKVDQYNATLTGSNASTKAINTDIYHPNASALTALRARFYLYEHRFDEAINEAYIIVGDYPLATGLDQVQDLWLFDSASEIIYEPEQTQDEITNTYGIYLTFNITTQNLETYLNGMSPDFLPTHGLVNLYESDDYRRKVYFSHKYSGYNSFYVSLESGGRYGVVELVQMGYPADIAGTNGKTEDGVIFTKFSGNAMLRKQGLWYSEIYNMSKAFRSAEAYLIIAEASLRKAAPDEAEARDMLNQLREARGASPIADDVTGDALVKEMQDEWTREFVGEGFRLDCLKRWHQGFKRLTPQRFNNPVLVNVNGYQNLQIDANDKRFVWPIPQQDMQANPNLKQNEGY